MSSSTAAPAALLNINVTTTFNSFVTERRFAQDLTIKQLKHLLEGLTGANPASMELTLFRKEGALVGHLNKKDEVSLTCAGVENGMTIEVSDASIKVGEFEDTSKVKKFELSEEEYANRAESLRAFKQRNKMGQFGDGDSTEEKKKEARERFESIQLGTRCLVTVPGQPPKKGTLMYKGPTSFKPGFWIGVKYDEPLGKHDGSVEGKRYFECGQKYGAFVKPESVAFGDYPQDNLMDEM
ncbi:Tubulin-folding cofactor B [Hypsibius exemplaris]|uniref:Tubulin-folding cofactor B n=1 Tax=Hypsibius exemplaris TaxID=2072580 RepID=A0A1W0XB18_HYPEX|nr:Tubulin-folding cofactor B [Hypsibius exemplaris]